MKVKLLKKIRKRFKWKYLGEVEWMKRMPRLYWEVFDSKGTHIEQLEHVSHFRWGNMVMIDNPSIAEQLTMRVMGLIFVFNHQQHVLKRMNRSFKKKHFNE